MSVTDFGKVAVLMGGQSAERVISLRSGEMVLSALLSQGIDAHKVDVDQDVTGQLTAGEFDRAFIILHGRGGEDGQIQGVLNSLAIPYTGSDITGAVLSMNKALSKDIWQQVNLPTAGFSQVDANTNPQSVIDQLGLPLFVKPVNEGSSIDMTKVTRPLALSDAIDAALVYDHEVIAERWIDGGEYTVAILGEKALPVIRLKTPNDFYDFDAKYEANTTEYLCPAGLSDEDEKLCQDIALKAFKALRMQGWGRVDLMRDQDGQFYLLEANSIPGMTDHSLVPMAAKQIGLSFEQLVMAILETSIKKEAK
ncbi:MAG: D-alanine--D-alanine ligase [Piscirickettsiaceae bacterium]|nr:D-alanine--D-alanine ligase [Piscirickettsiaceae bacterium]